MNLVPKNINEAIKHLGPRSKKEIDNTNKRIKTEYEHRKVQIKKLMDYLAKSYNTTVKYSEVPDTTVKGNEFKPAKDFSGDIQLTPRFSFWVRNQNYTDEFEAGWALKDGKKRMVSMGGRNLNTHIPVIEDAFDWEEFSDIDDAEDKIHSWINDHSDYKN